MGLPNYESREVRIVNGQCRSLPACPACDDITNLDEIIVERTAEAGSGQWVAYILRCASSVDPHGLRRTPPCTFAVPMTLQQPKWNPRTS